jgi:hypothetical protein
MQINKTVYRHMKMNKCFITKQQTDLKLVIKNQITEMRIILKWINTIQNTMMWTDSVGLGCGPVANPHKHSASKKAGISWDVSFYQLKKQLLCLV